MLSAARPPAAEAQEIFVTGPLATGKPVSMFSTTLEYVAQRQDVHTWIALGGTPAPDDLAGGFAGVGAQATASLTTFPLLFASEIRWGPWGQMSLDGVGGRAEGGVTLQLYLYDRMAHYPVDLRFGGGYGEDALGRVPHVAFTISAGPRYIEGKPWPGWFDRRGNPIPIPQLIAGWRFFLSGRHTVEPDARFWVTGGIELEIGFTARPGSTAQ